MFDSSCIADCNWLTYRKSVGNRTSFYIGAHMYGTLRRRSFLKRMGSIGGLSLLPASLLHCDRPSKEFLPTLEEYDIFAKYETPEKITVYDMSKLKKEFPGADEKKLWIFKTIITILQGLVNRVKPRLYLKQAENAVDWLAIYTDEGHVFDLEEAPSFQYLLENLAVGLTGYIVIDPENLHSLNVAQTWASLENWLVVHPDMEEAIRRLGLSRKQDLRGRWPDRLSAYEWAFANLFERCSKHVVGDCCMDFPIFPSTVTFTISDFLVANKAFTVDLSASLRQRREYRLLDKIYAGMKFPSGMWGWHCTRDHEHYAVERAARKGVYTLCAAGSPNFSIHGAFKARTDQPPKQKPSPRQNRTAEKNKVYMAFMMTDGDAVWAMENKQNHQWACAERGDFALSWGFLPLLADIAPAMYSHYINTMKPQDYMVAGPSGAGYTYPHLYPEPKQFLRYSKYYMQKCGLEIVNITNWNDYTNWQEKDVPWFNPLLFNEMDNCLGYVRGMGESAFEPHYNFADKPYVFCGEGLHSNDKDDVATIKNFIAANPNRPLFLFCLVNISIRMARIKKIVDALKDEPVEFVRLDDFMHLVKSAFQQKLITEDLYPNRVGNERILIEEAPANWAKTWVDIAKLAPALKATDENSALDRLNADEAGLALGQKITHEDKADVLAYSLCMNMFSLVKHVLNLKGIDVNLKQDSIDTFMELYGTWEGTGSIAKLVSMWNDWDNLTFRWQDVVGIGRQFLIVASKAHELFQKAK
jgi:hypothetical protein